MNYTDYLFLPLSVLAMGIYFIFPKKIRWVWLLVISLLFLSSWGIHLLPVILLMTLISWVGGLLIQHMVVGRKNRSAGKAVLIVFVFLLLLSLIYFKAQKYLASWSLFQPIVTTVSGFFTKLHQVMIIRLSSVPVLSGMISAETILVPLGISYYTLSLIGYMADVFWKKESAERNYFKLLLFTAYYPKIVEGPISKHRIVAPRLLEPHSFDYQRVCFGLQRVVWGFFKKWVIADRLAIVVNAVFQDPEAYSGSQILIGAVFGALQLYCDFSGCMDIGLGVSECFGIMLEENFNHPFFSRIAAEFWRRWHITLGAWFKDYVYMPLSVSPRLLKITRKLGKNLGKRAGRILMTVVPLTVVWLLTGLWHGTGKNYLVWGCYWGLILILTSVFDPEIRKLKKKWNLPVDSKGYVLFQQIRTFLLFVISRLITLPGSLAGTAVAFRKIFTQFQFWKLFNGSLMTFPGFDERRCFVAVLALVLLLLVSRMEERGTGYREWVAARPIVLRWMIYYGFIFAVLIFGAYGSAYDSSAFVYMQY